MRFIKNIKGLFCIVSLLVAGSANATLINFDKTDLIVGEDAEFFANAKDVSIYALSTSSSAFGSGDSLKDILHALLLGLHGDKNEISDFEGDVELVAQICTDGGACKSEKTFLNSILTTTLEGSVGNDLRAVAGVANTPGAIVVNFFSFNTDSTKVLDFKLTLRACVALNGVCPDATPVPEPSTLAFLALGIMGLSSRRFKKKA